ncbi:MAG TPA: MarR family transcriptional regulator [Clostridia bacterium]|jgi:DNA-binding MarR family transcriptional regulator|nr:MarR family transcriptional regulator [Clostridia bacterium]
MNEEKINFKDFLTFQIGVLSRDLSRFFNNWFAEYNVTIGQALVMYALLDQEDRSIKDIAQSLELDSPAVSRLVDRLLKGNLITRKEDREDRRALKINLTEEGEKIARQLLAKSAAFNRLLREKLGEEKFKIFQEGLSEIKNALNFQE